MGEGQVQDAGHAGILTADASPTPVQYPLLWAPTISKYTDSLQPASLKGTLACTVHLPEVACRGHLAQVGPGPLSSSQPLTGHIKYRAPP